MRNVLFSVWKYLSFALCVFLPPEQDSVLQSCQRLPKIVLFSCSAIFTGHCRIYAHVHICVLHVLVRARESIERLYESQSSPCSHSFNPTVEGKTCPEK